MESAPAFEDKNHFASFKLGEHAYALDLPLMVEIVGAVPVEKSAGDSDLYGHFFRKEKKIPVVDLRKIFGIPQVEMPVQNFMVVVSQPGREGASVALWVDSVLAFLEISLENLEKTNELLSPVAPKFLKGQARLNGQIFYLLELEEVLRNFSSAESPNLGDTRQSPRSALITG